MAVKLEAYWAVENGQRRMLSEMPKETYQIVFQRLREETAVGQYTLPFADKTDMQVWIPEKETERLAAEELRIDQVRHELKTYIRIPDPLRRSA